MQSVLQIVRLSPVVVVAVRAAMGAFVKRAVSAAMGAFVKRAPSRLNFP